MQKVRLIYWLPVVALLALFWLGSTRAEMLSNVELVNFAATSLDSAVRLEWTTATELGTAGFKIRRSVSDTYTDLTALVDGQGNPIADGFVPALGNPTLGSDYEATDVTAVNGQAYRYVLVEVQTDFSERELAATLATAGLEPSLTPIVISESPPVTQGSQPQPAETAIVTPVQTGRPAGGRPSGSEPATAATVTPEPAPVNSADQINLQPPDSAHSIVAHPPVAENASGQVLALVQDEPTAVNGYPGPTDTPPAATGESYPGVAATPIPDGAATPYPATTSNDDRPPVSIIGEEVQPTPETTAGSQATPPPVTQGRLFLWGGFIMALLLFLTGIIGSIVLFTRRHG